MRSIFPRVNFFSLLLGTLWFAGLVVIYCIVPALPREGWRPTSEKAIFGFLSDGRSLITGEIKTHGGASLGQDVHGPLQLWNIESGRCLGRYFSEEDIFDYVEILPDCDFLQTIQSRVSRRGGRRLIFDARNGSEIASFPYDQETGSPVWKTTRDGRFTAFTVSDKDMRRIELHDVHSGSLLYSLEGYHAPYCFSADGCRFAATRVDQERDNCFKYTVTVWDVLSGKQVVSFKDESTYYLRSSPKEFSPDGEWLLTFGGQIRHVKTASIEFELPDTPPFSSTYTSDGRVLAIVSEGSAGKYLAFCDALTGAERPRRRIPLRAGGDGGMNVRRVGRSGRLLLAQGDPRAREPSDVERWLATIPALQRLGETKFFDSFVLVDMQTGHEVMRGGSKSVVCSPDERYLLTERQDGEYEIWDIPPRKPLWWVVAWAGGWTVVLAIFSWLLARRRRPSPRVQ